MWETELCKRSQWGMHTFAERSELQEGTAIKFKNVLNANVRLNLNKY